MLKGKDLVVFQQFTDRQQKQLGACARLFVDQQAARVIVPALQPASGHWFGAGNLVEDRRGTLYLVGRHRIAGDARTGAQSGQRGLELAVFRSNDRGGSFQKVFGLSKADLATDGQPVLSIEGSALHWTPNGVELFVSSEKSSRGYPAGFESFQKPGTGVWTIDHMEARRVEDLPAAPVRTILWSDDPRFLHVKDPVAYDARNGDFVLFFCTHPYSWSSSNTGFVIRRRGQATWTRANMDFFPRGVAWDVAITRATCVVDVPRQGSFSEREICLVFYDGGESLRALDEHSHARQRPRGYSCEEIGGAAYVLDEQWSGIQRLSQHLPWFVSPHGTGCSRYVDVLAASDGYYVTWQQSQPDLSQPLVMHHVPHQQILAALR